MSTPQPGDTSPADPGPSPFVPVPVERQIQCVERELAMRRGVYAKRVAAGSMTPEAARDEYDAMRSVHNTLVTLRLHRGHLINACGVLGFTFDAALALAEACGEAVPVDA